ncbi:MAG: tetratricopeptide repeat protein [Candidatus Aminicenantaceae bacterium]
MKKKTLLCIFIFFSVSIFMFPQEGEELLAEGDELLENVKDMKGIEEILKYYREALHKLDNKYEAYWRIARALYYKGYYTEGKKEKRSIFEQAIYYAEKAVDLEPEKPDGHYWLGVNYGKFGQARGKMKSLFLVKPIKREMNKVIELDRSYEDGGPDRVLGRLYAELPGIAGGDNEQSLQHLLKSLEYDPDDALTRLYLADTYLKLDEVEKARKELEYILNKEDDDRWVSGMNSCKKAAREMLKEKEFRK